MSGQNKATITATQMSEFLDRFSAVISCLLNYERFYGELIVPMRRVFDINFQAVAGVCIKDRVELHVNPLLFMKESFAAQIDILKHEALHILKDHIPRFKELCPEVFNGSKDIADVLVNNAKFQTLNVAADLSINWGLKDIPAWACFPKNFKLPDNQTMEWYHHELIKSGKQKVQIGNSSHDLWSQSDGDREAMKEKIRQHVKQAAENTKQSGAGSWTSEFELLVDKLMYKPRDWRGDIRRFAANSSEYRLETTRKKRNRRYGIAQPGYKKEEILHLGVAIDTSGSMPDEALHQAMAEIGNIAKHAVVTVVEADCAVKQSYVYDPRKQYKMLGRGGTAYQPAFDFFNKMKQIDGVIYIGDMDTADQPKKPRYPVLWAVYGGQKPPVEWGSKTKIEVKSGD